MADPDPESEIEKLYELALEELDGVSKRKGLWARAFAESDGDDAKARALYLRYRVQSQLKEEESEEMRGASDSAIHVSGETPRDTGVARRSDEQYPKQDAELADEAVGILAEKGYRVKRDLSGWRIDEPLGGVRKASSAQELHDYATSRESRSHFAGETPRDAGVARRSDEQYPKQDAELADEAVGILTEKGYRVKRDLSGWRIDEPLGGVRKASSAQELLDYARSREGQPQFRVPDVPRRSTASGKVGLGLGVLSIFLFEIGLLPIVGFVVSAIALYGYRHSGEGNPWIIGVGLALNGIYFIAHLHVRGYL